MTDDRPPPLELEACLSRPYPSSQKGGTLIVEDVVDLAEHERRLEHPDMYRPAACARCDAAVHIHDVRPRHLLADPAVSTEVIRFRCADRERCGAAWLILPGFLARHLWRSWPVVERAIESPRSSSVPARTRRRWRARLDSAARMLVALLTTAGDELWTALATAVGLDASRRELVSHYAALTCPAPGARLAELAALLHRLQPGIRLM